jgi:cytochrome oxidase assembly protein ShyY1
MEDQQIDKVVAEAEEIAASDYKQHESTARNHAKIQALLVRTNGELIKTIRSLDAKNSKLQYQVRWLSVIATIAAIIALFK